MAPRDPKSTSEEKRELVRVFRSLMDKGYGTDACASLAIEALTVAAVDPARCGHVLVSLQEGVYRCGRNAGHEGEHGRRR